ncbi:MAG TPA: hypothetical protein VFA89_12510 [Terriglobales bacterium]|nr:hypothetical protein [Terriglobales bacterium]
MALTEKPRILSISSDGALLRTRHMLLESAGYNVKSVIGPVSGLELCKRNGYQLLVLGHSIPVPDREKLIEEFRRHCRCSSASVIALSRHVGDPLVRNADYQIEADPEPLLQLVSHIVQRRAHSS